MTVSFQVANYIILLTWSEVVFEKSPSGEVCRCNSSHPHAFRPIPKWIFWLRFQNPNTNLQKLPSRTTKQTRNSLGHICSANFTPPLRFRSERQNIDSELRICAKSDRETWNPSSIPTETCSARGSNRAVSSSSVSFRNSLFSRCASAFSSIWKRRRGISLTL